MSDWEVLSKSEVILAGLQWRQPRTEPGYGAEGNVGFYINAAQLRDVSPATKWLAFLQNLSVGHDGNWERYTRAPP